LINELCPKNVVEHCKAVSKTALEIAKQIKANGYDVDLEYVEIGALLHDIGRCKTHGIAHGVEGAKILEKYPEFKRFARVCETHIGAGITKDEAKLLNLPPKDYLPETLEEKIIAHADNLTMEDKKVPIEVAIARLEKRLGKNHPAISRVKKLNDFIENLIRNPRS